MAHTVSWTSVRVAVFTLTTMAALSTCSGHHPTVRTTPKRIATPGESDPAHLVYQINVTSHITISHPNNVLEKPETDTPHHCGCVLEDDTEKKPLENPNHCNCVLQDDAEKPVTKPHGTPYHCCPCCCQCHLLKNCYKLYESPRTWSEAKRTCEQEGSHLVVINSKAEEELVKKVMGRHRRTFIGVRYLQRGDFYQTVCGERVSSTLYAHWDREPGCGGCSELCGTMWFTGEVVIANCNERRAFVCELPVCC